MLTRLADSSPLGRIFAAGLKNIKSTPEVMKESVEEAGRAVSHDLGRFLTTLGTIASISPLLGLFGTVVGMIEIFGSQTAVGNSPAILAHGISVALYNTAFGLIVAIPSMIFYRHFRSQVDSLTMEMEQQAIKLVEIVHGQRTSLGSDEFPTGTQTRGTGDQPDPDDRCVAGDIDLHDGDHQLCQVLGIADQPAAGRRTRPQAQKRI